MRGDVLRRICCIVLASLPAACGGSAPTSPSQTLGERTVTEHFVFRFSSGDSVNTTQQEAYFAWVIGQLGVSPAALTYNKYRDRAQMGAITGNGNTNAYAEPALNTIHTIWPFDNHEVVHVYAGSWGSPVALFGEGLAVAHQMNPASNDFVAKWSGTPLHDLARRFRSQGQLPSIASIAETAAFRAKDDGVTYPVAGSFVRFLIDREGIGRMRQLFGSMGPTVPLASVRAAFQGVYGYSLDEAEARWLSFLDGV
jgi:hypothetical protein